VRHRSCGAAALVTDTLLLLNVGVFVMELRQPTLDALRTMVESWGMIPREFALGQDLAPAIPLPYWATMVSSTFLHAGWLHLASNMVFLWLMGHVLERRVGAARMLGLYLLTGAVAGLAHVAAYPGSTIPTVGASGGISGLVGAYLSLLLVPRPDGVPAERLRWRVPALFLCGLWLANGISELAFGWQADQVASYAHAGGFLVGLTFALLDRPFSLGAALGRRSTLGYPVLRHNHDLRIPLAP
jgi:membrane associated rhomboid family serine protease